MDSLAALHRRFDQWSEGLSRAEHALLGGSIAFVVALGVSLLSGELALFQAFWIALGVAFAYFVVDPR